MAELEKKIKQPLTAILLRYILNTSKCRDPEYYVVYATLIQIKFLLISII